MWKPTKSEYNRVEKILSIDALSQDERELMYTIKYAYENPVEIDWFYRAELMALEEKYKKQLKK